jgi:hypothetical protein
MPLRRRISLFLFSMKRDHVKVGGVTFQPYASASENPSVYLLAQTTGNGVGDGSLRKASACFLADEGCPTVAVVGEVRPVHHEFLRHATDVHASATKSGALNNRNPAVERCPSSAIKHR